MNIHLILLLVSAIQLWLRPGFCSWNHHTSWIHWAGESHKGFPS